MPQIWPHPLDSAGGEPARRSRSGEVTGLAAVIALTCAQIAGLGSTTIGGSTLFDITAGLSPLTCMRTIETLIGLTSVCMRAILHPKITTVGDMAERYRSTFADLPRERAMAVFLDKSDRVLTEAWVGRGDRSRCPVDRRAIFYRATKLRAGSIALLHNHPSGDPSVSLDDVEVTRKIALAAEEIGIPLLDHIVFGYQDGYLSMRAEGLL